MAFIQTVDEREATGDLANLYRRVGNPDGSVDSVMKIHALNPETLRTHFEMYAAALHRPSPLTRAERELVAVAVSRLNGCAYCLRHHLAGLRRLLPDDRHAAADAVADGRADGLTPREAALVAYASKLTNNPSSIAAADVGRLRDAGLDDRAILDLAQITSYFAYVNRIVLGLGVHVEDDAFEIGQWPAPGPARGSESGPESRPEQ